MPVTPLTSVVLNRHPLVEFLGGLLVSGWVISLVGLGREAWLRRCAPKLNNWP